MVEIILSEQEEVLLRTLITSIKKLLEYIVGDSIDYLRIEAKDGTVTLEAKSKKLRVSGTPRKLTI